MTADALAEEQRRKQCRPRRRGELERCNFGRGSSAIPTIQPYWAAK